MAKTGTFMPYRTAGNPTIDIQTPITNAASAALRLYCNSAFKDVYCNKEVCNFQPSNFTSDRFLTFVPYVCPFYPYLCLTELQPFQAFEAVRA